LLYKLLDLRGAPGEQENLSGKVVFNGLCASPDKDRNAQ